ncbi:threonylcarbamoyladenosine dehydratase [Seminavis robusta]|uniref:Threonylcarbamoyladenosine dehydratase n=1 Tax=Seminavis robusta TaxID=568900 RepID=A0A9N8DES4_9STRA|nr:threonylcarbamoyladenosine dehydratase [Seminavis robusta]|eukprot:Sro84_g044680.1 threonylcarbamoyladenosine dehydratase (390) ;mRNA; f:28184-29497
MHPPPTTHHSILTHHHRAQSNGHLRRQHYIVKEINMMSSLLLSLLLLSTATIRSFSPTAVLKWSRNNHVDLGVAAPDELFVPENQEGMNGDMGNIMRDMATEERNLRFAGIGRLYAKGATPSPGSSATAPSYLEVIDRLSQSTVVVVGLGGVGSWAAEALCRSGIGNLVLIDLDDICISNTNRQLHATSTTVGRLKIDEMKRRLIEINPQCNITLIHDFVTADNVYDILENQCGNSTTALLDAMDGTKEKTALLAACVNLSIPIVTIGAAAGRMDPTKIVVDDLIHVENDRLLATCRKNLRKFHGFERGLKLSEKAKVSMKKREWKIPTVFSTEVPPPVCNDDSSSFRRCDGPMGTACFVTGSYGFVAASLVVEMIATGNLLAPKQQHK